MKFSCQKSILTQAVTNVSRMIPSKSSIPALEGIKISAKGNEITLSGYDMEAGITTTIPAAIEQEGEIVLSARLFSDMIRKMAADEISIHVGERYLTEIKGGMSEFTIIGLPASDFPELPTIEEGTALRIPQGVLKSMIDQTDFAIAVTDSKPVHMGALFDMKDGVLSVVAVDGYRLAMRKEKVEETFAMEFVVPGKVLSEISKMSQEDSEEVTQLTVSGQHIVFEIGNYSIISRLLEGEFLDYASSIPQGFTSEVTVNTRSLVESVERASLLISDRLRSPLRVLFSEDGEIQIECSTSLGKFYDETPCQITGESIEIGFNNKYLLDALRAADTDEVRIELSGPLSPIKVLPPTGDDFLFLVLPVRLPNRMD